MKHTMYAVVKAGSFLYFDETFGKYDWTRYPDNPEVWSTNQGLKEVLARKHGGRVIEISFET